jgi:hypothetical protein
MSQSASIGDLLGDAAAGFGELLGGWTEAVTSRAEAEGVPDVAAVLRGMGESVRKLAEKVWAGLEAVLGSAADAAEFVAAFVAAGIEELIAAANALLATLNRDTKVIGSRALAALLGLVEAIKKGIHLVVDKAIRPIDPRLAAPITVPLDLLNNLIGNMAEVLSPDAGATARRFRSDMYGQLFEVRRAEGAFRPVVATAEEPPATR